ncbi:hypothetical protein F5Y16DRAFT_122578 [Xylariaceae sp. FL0255]|nr:hypothetical protein F5Y16DRAFT_122578 [Xylariaceae sp. FL0255]
MASVASIPDFRAFHFIILFFFLFTTTQIPNALAAAAAAAGTPRYAALDNAAVLPGGSLEPRWYAHGIPATPAIPNRSSPNPYFIFNNKKRQDAGNSCGSDAHTCYEINKPSLCCPNDRYCYLDENWDAQCCELGVQCPNSVCDATQEYCNKTITTTSIKTVPTGKTTILTGFVQTTQSPGCCARSCSESSYKCQPTFGGQCCPNSGACATGGQCIIPPTSSSSISTVVSEIPSGCTAATQFSCASSLGGGCCDLGSACVYSPTGTTSTGVCSPTQTAISPGNATVTQNTGLSSGAKAGIGVGVAIGAAIVIAAITWLCLKKRHRPGQMNTNGSAVEMRVSGVGGSGGGSGARGAGDAAGIVGRRTSRMRDTQGPASPWTAFSDASSPTAGFNRPPLHEHGLTYEYFGPDAVEGPYTDRGENPARNLSSPGIATTPPTSEGYGGTPYNPDHIRQPIEIGESERVAERDREKQIDVSVTREVTPLIEQETEHEDGQDVTAGRYELYGSPTPDHPDQGLLPEAEGRDREAEGDGVPGKPSK